MPGETDMSRAAAGQGFNCSEDAPPVRADLVSVSFSPHRPSFSTAAALFPFRAFSPVDESGLPVQWAAEQIREACCVLALDMAGPPSHWSAASQMVTADVRGVSRLPDL